MALPAGTRLGPYEILEPLGAGGMGEVYRARDTRLDRTVAVKVLPAELAADPQLKARFEREARAISALAHPHICTLHDIGEQDGRTFLVMEHLVGRTLAERLEKGALPLESALEIATQIADALSAAHKQGIVHRDLKPGNVMLTKSGAHLLDFGLARLTGHGEQAAFDSVTSAPTKPAPFTGQGTVLGTLPYMAPEQVEGQPADARTDLWALGTVLYEMITGRRAFEAASPVSLIGAILEREPTPLRERQPLTPPSLERVVRRCLAKDPDDRWDTAHDLADELRWVAETAVSPGPEPSTGSSMRLRRLLGGATLLVTGLLGGTLVWALRPGPTSLPVVRALLDVAPADEVNAGGYFTAPLGPGGSRPALAWLPDGQTLVFVGRRDGVQQLWMRRLDQGEASPIAGTEGAAAPALSPDAQWVAFWADGAIRKIPMSGGPAAVLVADVPCPFGMSWGTQGELLYGHPWNGIWEVGPGGLVKAVTTPPEGESHSLPSLLRGGEVLLFTVRRRVWTWGGEEVVAQVLSTGERTVVLSDAADARYVPTGHLVFMRRGALFAAGFDPKRLAVRGPPVALLDGVSQALRAGNGGDISGVGQFAIASTGALAYVAGEQTAYPDRTLVAVDREGRETILSTPPRHYGGGGRFSPDGRRITVLVQTLTERAGWVFDTERGTLTRLTQEEEVGSSLLWSPDGQRIAFGRLLGSPSSQDLVWQRDDGGAPPEVLARDVGSLCSWSPDGRQFFTVKDGDIWAATIEGSDTTLQRVTDTPHFEAHPELSPDGRWLAYTSNESGRLEVYVQPWPGPGPHTQVSVEGGSSPTWSPDGEQVFFLSAMVPGLKTWCRAMMVVDVEAGPTLRLSRPRTLFEWKDVCPMCGPQRCYDVAPDGQHFLKEKGPPVPEKAPVTQIRLIQNWLSELERRVPTH